MKKEGDEQAGSDPFPRLLSARPRVKGELRMADGGVRKRQLISRTGARYEGMYLGAMCVCTVHMPVPTSVHVHTCIAAHTCWTVLRIQQSGVLRVGFVVEDVEVEVKVKVDP